MKKSVLIKIATICIFFNCFFNINLLGQVQIQKNGAKNGKGMFIADGFIEMLNEDFYISVPGLMWVVTGGTIVSGQYSQNMTVRWDTTATSHSLVAGNSQGFVSQNMTIQSQLSLTGGSGLRCSNAPIFLDFNFSIYSTINAYDRLFTMIRLKLVKTADNSETILGEFYAYSYSYSNSLSFVPENIGITDGNYTIRVEAWRHGDNSPIKTVCSDPLEIRKAAPRVTDNDLSITELFTGKDVNQNEVYQTTFSINKFDYMGVTYSRELGNFPTNNKTFLFTGTYHISPGYYRDIWPTRTPIGNWSDFLKTTVPISSEYSYIGIQFEEAIGNNCVLPMSYTIPRPSITPYKPTCATIADGRIEIRVIPQPTTFSLYSYDGTNKVLSSYTTSPITGGISYNNILSGEYVLRIQKGPIIIEKYYDLRTPAISISSTHTNPINCNPEEGSISGSALNVRTGATFTLFKDGVYLSNSIDNNGTNGWTYNFAHCTPGNYTVSVSHGCINETPQTGTIPILPALKPTIATADTNIIDALCFGGTGQVKLNSFNYNGSINTSPAPSGFNFFIDNVQDNTGSFLYNIQHGTPENLTIQHIESECISSPYTLRVNAPPAISYNIVGNTSAKCQNTADGSVTLSASGGTGPYQYSWQGYGLIGPTLANVAGGYHTVTISDNKNCSITDDVFIDSPDELLVDISNSTLPTCFGGGNGSLSVSGSGGNGSYTFAWPDSLGLGNVATANSLYAGSYLVKISDVLGCKDSVSVVLNNPPAYQIPLNDIIQNCYNHLASLDAGPGSQYRWIFPNGTESDQQLIESDAEGNYTITVTDANGCKSTKTVFLDNEDRTVEAIFLIASEATMADTIVAIEVSWPYPDSLDWSIPNNFEVINDLDFYKELVPKATGDYNITMDAWLFGCKNTMEKTITIVPDTAQEKSARAEELIKRLKLFPNPNTGVFKLEVELSRNADIKADLYSQMGIKALPTVYRNGEKYYLIDYKNVRLAPGLYYLTVIAEDQVRRLKFVVQ